MKTEATIKQLTDLKDKATDPNIKKEVGAKLEFLKTNKTVEKNDNL